MTVGDAPLSARAWHKVLLESRERLAAWRELSGGQEPVEALIEILKEAPIEIPDKPGPVPMREVMGEGSRLLGSRQTRA